METSERRNLGDGFEIRVAENANELEDVYRVRKEVYIDELGFRITGSLAEKGILFDANKQGRILIAYDQDTPVGTVAFGWWKDLDVDHIDIRHFQLAGFATSFSPAALTMISKWLVRRKYRGSRLALELAKTAFSFIQDKPEIEFTFIDSSPYLVHHYQALGFRHYAPPFQYDEGGILSVPMCLVLGDLKHLSKIKSPVYPLLRRFGRSDRPGVREYFETCWAPLRYGGAINLQDPGSYFALTESEIIPEHRVSPLFEGMSDSQVQLFCGHGTERTYNIRDVILSKGERSDEFLLLTEGYVEISRDYEGRILNIATLGPGDLVGDIDFLLKSGHGVDIRALTESRALVFPTSVLDLLLKESPTFAAMFYRNLSKVLAQRVRAGGQWITEPPPL